MDGQVVADEYSHLISRSSNHDQKWSEACMEIFGYLPTHNAEFDNLRRRLGMPATIAANIGNITGIQQMLTDYTLLQQYRRFSQRILGTEGHWECLGDNKIRLYPCPRGSYPVVVLYIPTIQVFRSPQARKLTMDMITAEAKIVLGSARAKFQSIPSPDGGAITFDGAELRTQGLEERKNIIELANNLAEPLPILRY
jgi:hypothetical protein